MNALCWNCRGAGKPTAVRELREFAKKFTPTLLCIVETQIEGSRVEALASSIGYDNAYAVDSQGRSGGIGLFWNNVIKIEILGYSCYHLDVSVEEEGEDKWRLTCVCGEAQTHLRHQTWTVLKNISSLSSLPWICIGDFNEVLCPTEHEGVGQRSNAQIQAFRDTIDVCMLIDLGYKGHFWTFEKKVVGVNYTRVRLDRALATAEWNELFPNAQLKHLSSASSDHCPIISDMTTRKKSFRYEVMWETHESWGETILANWTERGAAKRLDYPRAKLTRFQICGASGLMEQKYLRYG